MKRKCNLFLLLLFLLLRVEAAKANVETFDFAKMGFSDFQKIKEVKEKDITVTFDSIIGNDVPIWNKRLGSVVVYGSSGNSFKIAANHPGYRIWQIVITFSDDSGSQYIIPDKKNTMVDRGTYKPNNNITTWTGPSDSVRFTNHFQYQWWIQKIDVYYSEGAGTATDPYTVGDINTFFYIENPPKQSRYIKGVVSKVDDPSTGTVSYHLSDNGIDTATIVVNGRKYLKDEAIIGKYKIARGDTLTVYGTVTQSKDDNELVLQSPSLASMNQCKDQITIKAAGWATYVSHRPIDFSKTKDVQAFQTRYDVASNTIVLSPVNAIPENTAVVLKGAKGSYTFENTENTENVVPLTSNELTFFTVDTPVTEDRTVYVLACKQGVCGFFPFAKGKSMPSYKGYLPIKSAATPKPFYRVSTTPTAIRPVEQLQHRAVRYNLKGERVDNSYKGVVIENGRKIVVK